MERTWQEILKHFVTALIFGTLLGSFIDIGTDGQKEELKLSATLFPLFFTNGAFKVISISIIAACLRYIGIALALAAFFIFGSFGLNVLGKKARCCPKRFTLSEVNVDMTTLHLNLDDNATKKQNLKTAVYTNATVGICLLVVLTTLVGISNTNPDSLNYAITS